MKRLLWWLTFLLCLGGLTVASAQHYPRFHRYAQTRFDSQSFIDLIKDAATQQCYAVYRFQEGYTGGAATLGPVPCEPIPVPPIMVPASPIR